MKLGSISTPMLMRRSEEFCYVDDCLKAVPTEAAAIQMISHIQSACKHGGFSIAKFSTNSANVLGSISLEDRSKELQICSLDDNDLPPERALGIYCNVNEDSFSFSITMEEKPLTRRLIFSTVLSVYDTLGFIARLTLYTKSIFKDLFREERPGWDETIPDDYVACWCD